MLWNSSLLFTKCFSMNYFSPHNSPGRETGFIAVVFLPVEEPLNLRGTGCECPGLRVGCGGSGPEPGSSQSKLSAVAPAPSLGSPWALQDPHFEASIWIISLCRYITHMLACIKAYLPLLCPVTWKIFCPWRSSQKKIIHKVQKSELCFHQRVRWNFILQNPSGGLDLLFGPLEEGTLISVP